MDPALSASVSAGGAEAPLILALDVGTSSTRAMLFDSLGRSVEGLAARRPYLVQVRRDGTVESEVEEVLTLLFECIDEALERAGSLAEKISAVSACTYVSNLVGIDSYGQPVTPVILYSDTRPAPDVAALKLRLDESAVHQRTGCQFHPSYLPARFVWMAREKPEWLQASARWMTLGEFAMLKLFGQARVSYSVASWSGLLNRLKLDWDDELLAVLPLRREQLSPLSPLSEPWRGLRPAFARRWPALADIPWFPAVGDGAAANAGDRCVTPRRVAVTVGTSSAVRAMTPDPVEQVPAGLWCYRLDRTRSLLGGALSEGGGVFAWLRRTLEMDAIDHLEEELARIPPDGHGLTFLPLLAGERSPGWRGDLRGAVHGLSLATTPVEITRAALEGMAYRLGQVYRLLAHVVEPNPTIVLNGGAVLQSPVWIQIIADVLGLPVRVSRVKEASARGAALLALRGLGLLAHLEDAPDFLGEQYPPDPARHQVYLAAMARQEDLYHQVRG